MMVHKKIHGPQVEHFYIYEHINLNSFDNSLVRFLFSLHVSVIEFELIDLSAQSDSRD